MKCAVLVLPKLLASRRKKDRKRLISCKCKLEQSIISSIFLQNTLMRCPTFIECTLLRHVKVVSKDIITVYNNLIFFCNIFWFPENIWGTGVLKMPFWSSCIKRSKSLHVFLLSFVFTLKFQETRGLVFNRPYWNLKLKWVFKFQNVPYLVNR